MARIPLPYPISANRYWRIARNRLYRSKEAEDFKRFASVSAKYARQVLEAGHVAVDIVLRPKLNVDGKASKTRLDLDNAIKVALDALNGIAWHDDKQVVSITASIGPPIKGGGLEVAVIPMPAAE